jgi:hypothetical protein
LFHASGGRACCQECTELADVSQSNKDSLSADKIRREAAYGRRLARDAIAKGAHRNAHCGHPRDSKDPDGQLFYRFSCGCEVPVGEGAGCVTSEGLLSEGSRAELMFADCTGHVLMNNARDLTSC